MPSGRMPKGTHRHPLLPPPHENTDLAWQGEAPEPKQSDTEEADD